MSQKMASNIIIAKMQMAVSDRGQNNIFNKFLEFAVETMKKYIEKLEQENQALKDKIRFLEGE